MASPAPYSPAESVAEARRTTKAVERSGVPAVRPNVDAGLIVGMAVALGAMIAGVASTGIGLGYFFQPTGALIVIGGTFGVTLISTPRMALVRAVRRVAGLLRPAAPASPQSLVEGILAYSRIARNGGMLKMEPAIAQARHPFLRQVLALGLDVRNREELRAALDVMLRARERQGESDAKALETAGGFAPTIGVLGTVVGLIDALRHFSDLSSVATGVGTAFVSTMYGLALANLLLLPAAHRIRSGSEDDAQADELIAEGGLGIYDSVHPTLLRERLNGFLRNSASA
ncbi:MAG TPA: MotA/TolQ/ExbB proton channel family protein [Bryobacteraceae bacterium]|nr:MotA/TolQ/ExbB proton channel family protein [Bryobacteraceae bacterium]